ncbi:MAG TPA: HAD-IB family phosphatase [Patescibacteria group bacterium]|nr:HAD-IB family phosphatase [Patescibacteria group bacterium]
MNYHFAFDLDGTITKTEILPVIAKDLGIGRKMAILTRKTMNGEIPFDESFTRRVDMLKKIPISRVQQIISTIPLNLKLVTFLRSYKNRSYIVTQNLDVWIKPLVERIGIPYICSHANYEGDKLKGIRTILRKKEIHGKIKHPVVAIGEGYNDFEMMQDAAISIAYGGVHKPAPSLLEMVDYAIYDEKTLCQFLKQLL